MPISFDQALGVHVQALELRTRRAEVIATNLANADTPNYLARDLDFGSVLADVQGANTLRATNAAHIQGAGTGQGEVLYRVPTQSSIDGNTVEEEQEKAAFSTNAIEYQTSLRLLSGRIRGLLSAIRGE